jgi:N6-L-threonylcarbamoyladenine synthase
MFSTHTLVAYPIVSKFGLAKHPAVAITVGGTILTDTAVLIILAIISSAAQGDLDFSFSGLKTSLRYQLEKMTPAEVESRMDDLCASYQQAVVDALVRKTTLALARESFRSLGLSGGVANNQTLRAALGRVAGEDGIPLLAAQPKHTGDNAGMIAFAAWIDPSVKPAMPLASLSIEPGLAL